ncbi:hypothetical protein V2G26_003056 [Clonostachys chloroleuca]
MNFQQHDIPKYFISGQGKSQSQWRLVVHKPRKYATANFRAHVTEHLSDHDPIPNHEYRDCFDLKSILPVITTERCGVPSLWLIGLIGLIGLHSLGQAAPPARIAVDLAWLELTQDQGTWMLLMDHCPGVREPQGDWPSVGRPRSLARTSFNPSTSGDEERLSGAWHAYLDKPPWRRW